VVGAWSRVVRGPSLRCPRRLGRSVQDDIRGGVFVVGWLRVLSDAGFSAVLPGTGAGRYGRRACALGGHGFALALHMGRGIFAKGVCGVEFSP
jgi:hypothetical protein